jgi:hypothetical protein
MSHPPTFHGCCGTPCFYETTADEQTPCWGQIICIDTDLVELEDGSCDEYRYGACEGHIDMYRTYDKKDYKKPNASSK